MWILALADAVEVLPVPKLTRAPLSKSSYAGLANVRGNLYSVVDFAASFAAPWPLASDLPAVCCSAASATA